MNKKTLFPLLVIGILCVFGITLLIISNHSENQTITNCGDDYNCLYQKISEGKTAKIVINEEVESLSIIEKSEIKVEPKNDKYEVTLRILDLQKIEKQNLTTRSIVESISETCPRIINNLDKIRSTSAVCMASTPEEAKNIAVNGLNEETIRQNDCTGELINQIREICITSGFPPGVRKPAVYLYPIEKSNIKVSVELNGFITQSEPTYLTGWNVIAEPSGLIDGKFDYLFYEAQLKELNLPEEGWVVKYDNLNTWFDTQLILLGLNENEKNQFKEYWLNELPKSKYYEVRLFEDSFLKENMNLIISPQPDTVIRLNFYFKPLNKEINIQEPVIITPERIGFTVVEWGGVLDN